MAFSSAVLRFWCERFVLRHQSAPGSRFGQTGESIRSSSREVRGGKTTQRLLAESYAPNLRSAFRASLRGPGRSILFKGSLGASISSLSYGSISLLHVGHLSLQAQLQRSVHSVPSSGHR